MTTRHASASNAQRKSTATARPAEARTSTSAVGKAFAILRVLRGASSPLTLTAIADEVGMAPSSAHSVLNQLLEQEAICQDHDKRYVLGPSVLFVGSGYARGSRVYRAIWMELVATANELGVTSALAVPWNERHLVLNAHLAGRSEVAVPFGGTVPLTASSWGKVYYGWSGVPLVGDVPAYTDASITDHEAWMAEIAEARRLGYAVDRGEFFDGVGGVAAPLTSDMGYEGLASLLGPLDAIEEIGFTELGTRLGTLTARASLALGDRERFRFFGAE